MGKWAESATAVRYGPAVIARGKKKITLGRVLKDVCFAGKRVQGSRRGKSAERAILESCYLRGVVCGFAGAPNKNIACLTCQIWVKTWQIAACGLHPRQEPPIEKKASNMQAGAPDRRLAAPHDDAKTTPISETISL